MARSAAGRRGSAAGRPGGGNPEVGAIRRLEQSGGWSNPEVGAIRRLEQSLAEARQDLVDLDESPAPYNWQWRDLGTFRDIPPPVQLVDFDGENYL